ncbi:MAG: endonuclease/exonuclease/phosphatase family protein [Simkaniaceae bacterium]|nr:endonuclease/exonuclease/phosphatase family protein [Simkaniaceae bacterium]
MHSNQIVIDKTLEIVKRGHVFICGDFNSFPSDGGKEELNLWKDFIHLTKAPLTNQNGIPISGTWRGYPYDKFLSPNASFGAQLDHIFARSIGSDLKTHYRYKTHINTMRFKAEPLAMTEAEIVTNEDGSPRRDFPSDHMPVIVHAIPI